jgi:SAM-dependent methyltransferase
VSDDENFSSSALNADYWDQLADQYQSETRISTRDFHYGPLLPGDRELGLLPTDLKGKTCLELGAGAAQNSIYLAAQGATCTALDISEKQLAFARQLATKRGLPLTLVRGGLDELDALDLPTFDLVHSTYALPFADDPGKVVETIARKLLNPGGTLLLTMGHPLYSGEWIELDQDERGLFLTDYFYPPNDTRTMEKTDSLTVARYYPISEMIDWLLDAGLHLTRFLEPRPLPIPTMKEEDILNRVPYDSPGWRENFDALDTVPVVAVLKATKPA